MSIIKQGPCGAADKPLNFYVFSCHFNLIFSIGQHLPAFKAPVPAQVCWPSAGALLPATPCSTAPTLRPHESVTIPYLGIESLDCLRIAVVTASRGSSSPFPAAGEKGKVVDA